MNIQNCQLGMGNEVEGQISLNIYFAGCKDNKPCQHLCHNPELRDFDAGLDWTTWKSHIIKQVNYNFFTCFCILGGEPLDQNEQELLDFFSFLTSISHLPIYIYSGYSDDSMIARLCYSYHTLIKGVYLGHYIEGSQNNEHKSILLFQ